MDTTLGERLRGLRTSNGWNLRELAEKSGHSASYLSAVERGEKHPGSAVLSDLGRALGVSVDYLLTGIENPILNLPEPAKRVEFNILTPVDFEAKVVGVTSAGKPTLSPTDYLESLSEVLKLDRARHFLVTVASETVNSVGFRQGDTVVVDSRAKPVLGSVVFAGIEGMPVLVRLMSDKDLKGVNVAGVVVYVLRGI